MEELTLSGGGEIAIAAMDRYAYAEIGRKTYRFVRRMMQNPEYRAMIKARAAQIREEEASALGRVEVLGLLGYSQKEIKKSIGGNGDERDTE